MSTPSGVYLCHDPPQSIMFRENPWWGGLTEGSGEIQCRQAGNNEQEKAGELVFGKFCLFSVSNARMPLLALFTELVCMCLLSAPFDFLFLRENTPHHQFTWLNWTKLWPGLFGLEWSACKLLWFGIILDRVPLCKDQTLLNHSAQFIRWLNPHPCDSLLCCLLSHNNIRDLPRTQDSGVTILIRARSNRRRCSQLCATRSDIILFYSSSVVCYCFTEQVCYTPHLSLL